MRTSIRALVASAALVLGCGSMSAQTALPAQPSQREAALPAITALQRGSFEEARQHAEAGVRADGENPYALLVRAITRYERAMHQLVVDGRTVVVGGVEAGGINQRYLESTFTEAERELAAVERDLAAVARHQGTSVELCLACWDLDWNGNGRIDNRDRLLLQIEEDADGKPIPEGDPRRKPTFRFDDGDVPWARAFVSFQRAALDVLLAYDWSDLPALARRRRERPDRVVVRLKDAGRIGEARQRILEGLDQSDAARRAYLAETDDDREWVPSPRQKDHPLPLPVDQALYDTWEGVVGDVRRLVRGEEGLSLGEIVKLTGERMKRPPSGYLDIGRMLEHPKDIVIDVGDLERAVRGHDELDADAIARSLLGEYYVPAMKPSPLPARLLRMKGEVDDHREEIGRKLRYLFWLN